MASAAANAEGRVACYATMPCTAVVIVACWVVRSSSRRVILVRSTSSSEVFEEDERGLFCGEPVMLAAAYATG
ncbi:MAG: hypothetical protein ACK56F_18870, partial [bacterium]